MPFFFIVPIWLVCLLAGAVLFSFARLRSLSLYVLLAPTGFTVFSFLSSTLVLLVAGRWPQVVGHSGLILVGGYIGALLAGGAFGTVAGLALAYKLNYNRRAAVPAR